MSILAWIVLGLLAGFIGSKIVNRRGEGILLDILLPDLDGLSVCEILRRQPSTKKIPVIFMSALTSEVTKRTVAMQAEDFFTKPLNLPRLVRRITDLLHCESLKR